MLNILFLLLGFIPLIIGADLLVENASSLAKRLNIPNIVIGLTIVAFGTSAPELIVNIFAALKNNSGIVLGNVIGSNLFNILAILGVSSIIFPLTVKSSTTWIEIPLALLAAITVLVMSMDTALNSETTQIISRSEGIILLFFFAIFMGYNISMMMSGSYDESVEVKNVPALKAVLLVLLGFILLAAGGKVIVEFAIRFARDLNISEHIIAITIVSIGTSLPELATSVAAARKKNVDIAIGNIVGSNIFNIFFILGVSAVITPVAVSQASIIDMMVNILSSLALFIFIFTGKGRKISRNEGILFLTGYVAYIIYLLAV